ncbi:MAG: sulfite exporter TauE/SafE family protein [Woeseiaceae bacterium]
MELGTISTGLVVVTLTAIAIGALIKGMTGLGLPLVAVPVIATFASVEEAVILMIIPTFGSNLWLAFTHRRLAALLSAHLPFLLAGLTGGIVGTFLLAVIEERWLKLMLAAWLAVYLLQFMFGNFLRPLFQARGPAAAAVGFMAGTIHGATGISAHIVAPYFHGRKLAPDAYALLIACAFLTFSGAQLVTAAATQLFTADRFVIGLIALIPTLVFTQAGIGLAGKISNAVFQRILIALFVLMEIKLIADVYG